MQNTALCIPCYSIHQIDHRQPCVIDHPLRKCGFKTENALTIGNPTLEGSLKLAEYKSLVTMVCESYY